MRCVLRWNAISERVGCRIAAVAELDQACPEVPLHQLCCSSIVLCGGTRSPSALAVAMLLSPSWGFAGDYAEAMWLMLQQERPDDYVIASGALHSVRQFVEQAASVAGFDLAWEGEGSQVRGIDREQNRTIVDVDPKFYRPVESDIGPGNADKARECLGWTPKLGFPELVEQMMRSDMAQFS